MQVACFLGRTSQVADMDVTARCSLLMLQHEEHLKTHVGLHAKCPLLLTILNHVPSCI
jgi:hypothetical protein